MIDAKEFPELKSLDIYEEQMFNGKWCYKFQAAGKPIIIVADEKKDVALNKLIAELKNHDVI